MLSLRSSTIAARRQRIVSGENGNMNGIPFAHPVRSAERLAVAQHAVVARGGLDGQAGGFEPPNELAHVLSHPFSWRFCVEGIKRKTACLARSAATTSSDEFGVASK
jgi:hypothetical protein